MLNAGKALKNIFNYYFLTKEAWDLGRYLNKRHQHNLKRKKMYLILILL